MGHIWVEITGQREKNIEKPCNKLGLWGVFGQKLQGKIEKNIEKPCNKLDSWDVFG